MNFLKVSSTACLIVASGIASDCQAQCSRGGGSPSGANRANTFAQGRTVAPSFNFIANGLQSRQTLSVQQQQAMLAMRLQQMQAQQRLAAMRQRANLEAQIDQDQRLANRRARADRNREARRRRAEERIAARDSSLREQSIVQSNTPNGTQLVRNFNVD